MSDLTETLRDITSAQGWLACDEAADEIERLTEEAETQVRVMQQVIDDGVKYKAEIQRLTAERDSLQAELKEAEEDYSELFQVIESFQESESVLLNRLAALEGQEPVAYVRFSDGEVDYGADAVISNTAGDCMDEFIEWRPVYAAAGAAPDSHAQQTNLVVSQNSQNLIDKAGAAPSSIHDTDRLAYLYSGRKTTSRMLLDLELKLLADTPVTLSEAREAIDHAIANPAQKDTT